MRLKFLCLSIDERDANNTLEWDCKINNIQAFVKKIVDKEMI